MSERSFNYADTYPTSRKKSTETVTEGAYLPEKDTAYPLLNSASLSKKDLAYRSLKM